MPERLRDLYKPGAMVEILLAGRQWHQALVLRSEPPGLWVRDGSGQEWFVTNGRHIRPLTDHAR